MLSSVWKKYRFQLLVYSSLAIIVVLWLFRDEHEEGQWSRKFVPLPYIDGETKTKRFARDSKGEIEVRRVLETIFKRPFPKIRPDFLVNPVTGELLELDCYNADLQLACEFDGIQHYKFSPHFHKNFDAFRAQQYRDRIKQELCREHGISLIVVPYHVPLKEIEGYVRNELIRLSSGN